MLVDCPWMRNGKSCGKKGYLVLETPRKKQYRRSKRSTNQKHKEYNSSGRPKGRYFRVHHYVYENGKRKSKFCYLGNFKGAVQKLKKIQKIPEQRVQTELKDWIDDAVKVADKIDVNALKPEDALDIYSTILNAQLCVVRNGYAWQKYI